jgi:hypothetical protein
MIYFSWYSRVLCAAGKASQNTKYLCYLEYNNFHAVLKSIYAQKLNVTDGLIRLIGWYL